MNITKLFYKTAFLAKKNSPKILLVSGLLLLGGAVVSTHIAARRYDDVAEIAEDPDKSGVDKFKALAKNYAAPAVFTIGSAACFVGMHNIMSARNIALAGALVLANDRIADLQNRIEDSFENDKDIKKIEDQDEREKAKKAKAEKILGASQYSRIFCEANSSSWSPDAEDNRTFLTIQERYWNDQLKRKGYVFLNDVYRSLGFNPTREGQVVGWTDYGTTDSDGYIDFGLYRFNDWVPEQREVYLAEKEGFIQLDFNVDGYILDTMPESGEADVE
jgi:hypothetical protein